MKHLKAFAKALIAWPVILCLLVVCLWIYGAILVAEAVDWAFSPSEEMHH